MKKHLRLATVAFAATSLILAGCADDGGGEDPAADDAGVEEPADDAGMEEEPADDAGLEEES
jgi:predicted small secreted protein